MKWIIVICYLLAVHSCQAAVRQRRFPDNLLFGASTAAYQIEGGWDADGKGENIWDYVTHTNPTVIKDLSNGDIAADSYHNYKRDVEMMRELGLDVYRFSLSWARILPNGLTNEINLAGIEFYNNYIDEMLKYGITPMITIYHWDLPQKLQELGGFRNPCLMDWFEEYARIAFTFFGDRVKHWITFNEPHEFCNFDYELATSFGTLQNYTDDGVYLCAKHLILAHARAYHAYNNDFKLLQRGEVGITIHVDWFEPLTDIPEDRFATEIIRQGLWGIYADPIFSPEGGFPKEFSERVAQKSLAQGYEQSRMPEFTEEEKAFTRGAADFFGVNHYTTRLISASEHKSSHPLNSVIDDINVGTYIPKEWPQAASPWLIMAPNSLRNVLTDLKNKYNNPVFYVTENGWSIKPDSGLIDDDRITYYRAALENVLDSLDAGVRLKGYMAWSLMDNFEWKEGYRECFGLYHVNFEDPARTRTPRKSAFVYKHIVANRYIDHSYEPDTMTMTIDEGH